MKESTAKVKENPVSARQVARVVLIAVALELLRPAIQSSPITVHGRQERQWPGIAAQAPRRPGRPTIAPGAIKLVEPVAIVAPIVVLL